MLISNTAFMHKHPFMHQHAYPSPDPNLQAPFLHELTATVRDPAKEDGFKYIGKSEA
jgi:hypothetical protein